MTTRSPSRTALPVSELDVDADYADIKLRLPACHAHRRAAVAGDFTAWVPIDMFPTPDGGWYLPIVVRCKGRLRYQFLVDDTVEVDPTKPIARPADPS